MSDRASECEYVDFLLWELAYCLSIAEEVSRLRSYITSRGMPTIHTDEWIAGWLGAEFELLNKRHTEDDPDLTAMVISAELDALAILPKIKAVIGDSVARNIVGYLYAYAKFNELWGPWRRIVAYIDVRFEEHDHAA